MTDSPTRIRYTLARDVLAVAERRGNDEWAAYVAAVPGNDHDAEEDAVVKAGCPLMQAVAAGLFPQFAHLRYRCG